VCLCVRQRVHNGPRRCNSSNAKPQSLVQRMMTTKEHKRFLVLIITNVFSRFWTPIRNPTLEPKTYKGDENADSRRRSPRHARQHRAGSRPLSPLALSRMYVCARALSHSLSCPSSPSHFSSPSSFPSPSP
jgi:hypothetical protein